MKQRHLSTSGFTAVELLVTLFVAAAFLVAGYQLFNLVIKDGGSTRVESTAGNVAYDYLRRYSDSATNPCTISSPLANSPVTIEGAANATVSISISCPQSDAPTLSKIEAIINYGIGNDANTVKFSTFIDKSRGATPNSDNTTGLVGWWKLNENTDSSAGALSSTPTQLTSTTGQNGQVLSAYEFSRALGSSILVPTDSYPKPTQGFTASAWVYTSNVTTTNQTIISTTNGGGFSMSVGGGSCASKLGLWVYVNGAYVITCSTVTISNNTWVFVAGVFDGSSTKLYVNNATPVTTSAPGTMGWPTTPVPFCIGGEPGPGTVGCSESGSYFTGRIDDVRYYNRALSQTEISTGSNSLYARGAQ